MNKLERREYERNRYRENPEYYRQKARSFRIRHREKVLAAKRAWAKQWRAGNLEEAKRRESEWRKANPEKVQAMGRAYRGLPEPTRLCPGFCECCGDAPGKQPLNLDHDHETGKFRGWLCVNCNTGLGKFGDNIAGLEKAIEYLSRASIDDDAAVSYTAEGRLSRPLGSKIARQVLLSERALGKRDVAG